MIEVATPTAYRMIPLDDPEWGARLGFTSDRYGPGSYLWISGTRMMVSFIESREQGKGAFRELLARIKNAGLTPAVPTPLARMTAILEHYGFEPHQEWAPEVDDYVEVWEPAANPVCGSRATVGGGR